MTQVVSTGVESIAFIILINNVLFDFHILDASENLPATSCKASKLQQNLTLLQSKF